MSRISHWPCTEDATSSYSCWTIENRAARFLGPLLPSTGDELQGQRDTEANEQQILNTLMLRAPFVSCVDMCSSCCSFAYGSFLSIYVSDSLHVSYKLAASMLSAVTEWRDQQQGFCCSSAGNGDGLLGHWGNEVNEWHISNTICCVPHLFFDMCSSCCFLDIGILTFIEVLLSLCHTNCHAK